MHTDITCISYAYRHHSDFLCIPISLEFPMHTDITRISYAYRYHLYFLCIHANLDLFQSYNRRRSEAPYDTRNSNSIETEGSHRSMAKGIQHLHREAHFPCRQAVPRLSRTHTVYIYLYMLRHNREKVIITAVAVSQRRARFEHRKTS